MIRRLHIRNYVLIESLDLAFDDGLTIITGETGAGKSILLGALGLILGDRAEGGVQADPDEKTVIEGTFHIGNYALEAFFEENDLDYHPELLIRRELSAQGRSRAFINDSPAGLSVLKDLGRQLIDVHQQFDQLDVLEEAFQIRMLDALAGQWDTATAYTRTYREWRQLSARIDALEQEQQRRLQELDFLAFQIGEMEAAGLRPGEENELVTEEKQLRHAEEIRRTLGEASSYLTGDEASALTQLQAIARSLQPLASFHPDLPDLLSRIEGLVIELQDWADTAGSLAEATESDPARLDEVARRVDLINRLLHKHKATDTASLLRLLDGWKAGKEDLEAQNASLTDLAVKRDQLAHECRSLARKLHEGRAAAATPFAREVEKTLAGLGMERIRLRLPVEVREDLTPSGIDAIRLEMAQMEGSRFTPVKLAASGGELSRLTLVIKSLVAAAIPLPTLVFDEIDAGVSGAVSMKVGEILTRMSRAHQLIVITHSPQIAARAATHYHVSKSPAHGAVRTQVQSLTGEGRVTALATMLSTDPPGDAAIANARELLAAAEG